MKGSRVRAPARSLETISNHIKTLQSIDLQGFLFLGHTKLATTQIYTKVLDKKVSDDFNRL
ncbi:hypothetical protein D2U88_19245 [Flagellimonas aequoris]|uniref:Uncharacterized protein n=1 Tax=Flagellimonas aequoris TaxID=2306997 RepID=A0A418N2X7_9FLAO|nr:hypothetical protein D2U88_19245 [Allomuricauda aequoris]